MTNKTILLTTLNGAMLCAALVGCGGGGSSDTPAPTLSNVQGFWSTAGASAVILPNGQAWVVYDSAGSVTALAQAGVVQNGSGFVSVGKYFALPGGAAQTYGLSGNLPAARGNDLSTSSRIGSGDVVVATWVYNKAYDTPVAQTSVQGHWSGKLGADILSWDFDAAGKLTGTSTTGCSYSGTLTVNPTASAVLDAAMTENCAGNILSLSGIATLGADKAHISLAYTTAGAAQGGVVLLAK